MRNILRHSLLHNHGTFRLRCKLLESTAQILHIAVNVQMVGIHGGDDGDFGMECQEGTVKLIGLDHGRARIWRTHVVVVQVLGNAAYKGRHRLLGPQQMRNHRGRGGLAMSAGHRQSLQFIRNMPEHLRTFVYRSSFFYKILVLDKILRNGRGINHKIHFSGNLCNITFKMDFRPFLLEHFRHGRRREVIAINIVPVLHKILRYSAHSDAANA